MCKIDIAGENYLTTTTIDITKHDESTGKDNLVNKEEVITLANGERYKKVYTSDGNLQELYFKSKTDTSEEFTDSDLIVQNIYDTHGNLVVTKETQKHRTHKYFIDKFGNHYKEQVLFANPSFTSDEDKFLTPFSVENSYDAEHDKVTETKIMVENKALNYGYKYSETPDKTLEKITLHDKFEQTLNYDKLGRLDSINLTSNNTNNLTKKFAYLSNGNHTSNLVSTLSFATDDVIKDRLSYKYDTKGNITEIRNNNILIARYKYDSLNRLVREDNKELEKTVTYSYDAGGNITKKLKYDYTLIDNLDFEKVTQDDSYTYSLSGWKDKLYFYNNEEFKYDKLGNPETYRGKELVWSHTRQLDKFDNVEFRYDSNGLRLSKIANGVFTKYYLNGNKIIAQDIVADDESKNNTLYFHYGADGVTGFTLNNVDYAYKKNAQNDKKKEQIYFSVILKISVPFFIHKLYFFS